MKNKNNLTIKLKLIILFVLIKVIPLIFIVYIAIEGIKTVGTIFVNHLENSFDSNKKLLKDVANKSIDDSIISLDKIAQNSLEKLTVLKAKQVAQFLYERDNDLIFLSKLVPSDELFDSFFKTKTKYIIIEPKYTYDEKTSQWITKKTKNKKQNRTIVPPKENEKNFSFHDTSLFPKKKIPIYKEITFIDLEGMEIYKKSAINDKLLDVSVKQNTFISAEDYFSKIQTLNKGEIYVSNVIGLYVGTKILGEFTKDKAKKAGIEFEPKKYGYAGRENPVGRRFEGIVRFATAYYEDNEKKGYITIALDHRHIMEFSDYFDPVLKDLTKNISDASSGDYAFINDHKYRMISHPKDYHIVGFVSNTGQRASPWLSRDLAKKFKESGVKNINKFLINYPKFENQTSDKKPDMEQVLKYGEAGLDCRYLNFAPQCTSFKKITQYGGYGSTLIQFHDILKITTTAAIPYFTGQYANEKVGFGTFGIGTNIDRFRLAADETRKNIDYILENEEKNLYSAIDSGKKQISETISSSIKNLTYTTIILTVIIIFIAIWLANYLRNRIRKITDASNRISAGDFDIKFKAKKDDEIGQLESIFENMAVILSNEIKNRTYQIKTEKEKAQKATVIKSEFIANMSHEIRTPISGIIGMSQLISKTDLNKKQENYMDNINFSANLLLSIVNDILDFSKMEAGKLELSKTDFDLKETILKVVNISKCGADEKGLDLTVNFDDVSNFVVYGDNIRIGQIFTNILSNAIKFTESGYVEINISNKDGNFIFKIEDSGIGISKEHQSNLFKSFTQADGATNRKYGGTGLGLFISKQLVELMGGKIWFSSELGVGSSFCFEINLPKGNASNIMQIDNRNNQITLKLRSRNILLAEDNTINQKIIIGLLENSGIEIDVASNGEEAVAMHKRNPKKYKLIFMDLQMPIMDGYEATKIIRKIDKNIPIVALTSNAMSTDIEKAKSAGMNEHLNKPIEIAKLQETVLRYTSEEQIDIPKFTNIDTKSGLLHMAGDKELYLKILNSFYRKYKDLKLENLSNDEIQVVLHNIKGLSANIGANRLSEILKEAEDSITLDENFYKELNKVLEELKFLKKNKEEEKLLYLDKIKRDNLFGSIKQSAADKKSKECNKIVSELKRYNLDVNDKKLLLEIESLLSIRDYKNIQDII